MSEPMPLDPDAFGAASPCFGCSPTHPTGLKMRFFREGDEVTTRFVPSELHQGPPGIVHGGLATTIGDELAAWTVIGLKQRFGFTAAIDARLKKPLRIGVEVLGRGRIESETARVVKIATTLEQGGALAFSGLFTFALLDEAAAAKLLGAPLPEAWRAFSR